MDAKVHGNTKKAADMALARREISRDSHKAVHEGKITLAEARERGHDRGPGYTGQASSGQDETRTGPRSASVVGTYCLCGCGEITRGGRFKPGHDARLHGELKRNLQNDPLLRNERYSDAQRRYAVERGLADPEVLLEEERDG